MINFTREQRGRAFDSLSRDLKSVITSNTLADNYQKIGSIHKLDLDKVGILADTVTLTILNLLSRNNLVSELSERMNIDKDKASIIAEAVNSEIFLKIREILKTEQESETVEHEEVAEESVKNENVDRESILAEIENPTPSIHPISAADQTVAGPAVAREILPETKSTVARDFIGSKLTETVSLPAQKAAVTLKAPEKPKSYAADPYREALN